jgi:hypothetical protein
VPGKSAAQHRALATISRRPFYDETGAFEPASHSARDREGRKRCCGPRQSCYFKKGILGPHIIVAARRKTIKKPSVNLSFQILQRAQYIIHDQSERDVIIKMKVMIPSMRPGI